MKNSRPKLPTRNVTLGGLDMEIPADWLIGENDRGFYWAGDENDTITLQVKTEIFERSGNAGGAHQSPSKAAEELAFVSVNSSKSKQLLEPITVDRVQSGCVVSIYDEIDGDSRRLRRYQWHTYKGRTAYVGVVYWALEISYPLPSEARVAELVRLFKDQAMTLEVFLRSLPGADAAPLKDLIVDALFTIRIPDWFDSERVVRPDGHAIWSCWATNGRPGKFLMANEFGPLSPELRGLDATALLRTFESHLDRTDDPNRRRISKTEIKAPLGQILRVIDDEKPRPLELDNLDRFYVRYHQWFYTMTDGQMFLRLFFNLSLPLRKLDHPDAATLPNVIEQEIFALRPLPPFEPIAP
jgi:hypothetical protein